MKRNLPPKEPEPDHPCPQCGALCPSNAPWCWLCKARLTTPPLGAHQAPRPLLRPWQFSLESLLVVITLAAVFLGLFMTEPGLGILLAILVAPALVHLLVVRHRQGAFQTPTTTGDKVVTFALSTAAALAALALGGAAFAAAIFASCIVEARVLAPRMPAGSQDLVAFSLIGISALIGLVTAGCLYAMLRPRK